MIDGPISISGERNLLSNQSAGPVAFADNGNAAALDRTDWMSFVVTTTVALSVYLLTLAPDVTLGFSGIFSAAAMQGGVPHPPGYPLSTIYSWMFVKLVPISTIAWRVAAASAVAGAAACGVIALIVTRLSVGLLHAETGRELQTKDSVRLRTAAAVCAGLVFGFSGPFWNRAVIADVWTLSVLSLCLVFLLLLRWTQEPKRTRHLYCAFFVYGLALTNSQMLLALGPAIPFLLLVGNREVGRDAFFCGTVLCGAGLAAALLDTEPDLWISPEGIRPVLPGYIAIGGVATIMATILIIKTRQLFTEWRTVGFSLFMFLGGLSLYLYVPIVSMTNPPMNWGYPRTAQGFFHLLSRGQYERIHPQTDALQYLKQLWFYLDTVGSGFGWINLAVAIIPFILIRRIPSPERSWLLASVAALICLGPLLIAVLNPASNRESWKIVGVLTSLSFVVLASWLGLGLIQIGRWHLARSRLH
jgi:hypothetical protein